MAGIVFWICVGTILYTYAGYPLLLALFARLKKPAAPHPASLPSITLLIAAHNERPVIAEKIENSLALDYPRDRLQILVAVDGSDDGTLEVVREYGSQGVETSYSPQRRGKTAALNRALGLARGEIVVFSDANNFYDVEALRVLAAPFADPSVGAVTGAKQIDRSNEALGESEGFYWRYESFIKKQETRLGCCTGVAGEILGVRRDLIEPPPDHIINDDFYMAMRIIRRGYRVVYCPEARSTEYCSASAQEEVARRARIVAGRYQAIALTPKILAPRQPLVVWQVVSHKFLRPLVPLAMAGALLASVFAVWEPASDGGLGWLELSTPFNDMLLGAELAFYGLALVGNMTRRSGRIGKVLYLPAFLLNSNAAAVIGLWRFLTRRQTTLWKRVNHRGRIQSRSDSGDRVSSASMRDERH